MLSHHRAGAAGSGARAPIQRLADRISAVFVPVVLSIAIATFVLWFDLGPDPAFLNALVAAVTVLIIACPCAMGLAVPTAVMVSTGRSAELGILIRGGEALERCERLDTVVLDKTGTVTEGRPAVRAVMPLTLPAGELLRLAASVDRLSGHPLGEALVRDAERQGLPLSEVSGLDVRTGRGVVGSVSGRRVAVGNRALLEELARTPVPSSAEADRLAAEGQTPLFVAVDGAPAGLITVADPIKPASAEAVARLHRLGIETVLLTGDNRSTASAVARAVGIERVVADVLPEGKLEEIRRLQAERRSVAMVGDGSTTRRRSRRPTWGSPWAPGPTWPWKPGRSRSCGAIHAACPTRSNSPGGRCG